MEKQENNKIGGQSWLQRVQEQSWEPEILISGIVLFALYQIPPLIGEMNQFLNDYSVPIFSSGSADETIAALLYTANIWLIAGFTAHLLFRSVWAAYVGLSYVYRDGVKLSNLRYGEAYKKIISKSSNYRKSILKLERICSTTFAVSFLLFMLVLGSIIFLLTIGIIISILYEISPDAVGFEWVDTFLQISFLVVVFDFVTLGLLKRIPVISTVYYPIYRVVSWLTLSPLYRNIYYGLVTNHKPWKIGVAMALFALISFGLLSSIRFENNFLNTVELGISSSDSQSLFHGHYEDLQNDDPSIRMQIPSDIIESDVLRAFIVHRSQYEERHIMPKCDYSDYEGDEVINRDSLRLACLDAFYNLELDGKPIDPPLLYHKKLKTKQQGLVAYIDISHLDKGMHTLELFYHLESEKEPLQNLRIAKIEFYRSRQTALSDTLAIPPDAR